MPDRPKTAVAPDTPVAEHGQRTERTGPPGRMPGVSAAAGSPYSDGTAGAQMGLPARQILTAACQTVELRPDRAVVDLSISTDLLQPFGIVHGGVYCGLAEHTAGLAAMSWLGNAGRPLAIAATTHFLRAIEHGVVRARALPVHCGRSQQLWRVEMTERHADKLVATADVRLLNVPAA